ncbi:hypothetical protein BJY04DRAFT_220445 [Aspergillus karnatakaensis]|uniref:GNAT family N-acetyltransferase n=1 Tax=Aspergillus karnatakaensis TaxID=1810916 RepID=UPI003CCD1C90
MAQGNHLSYFRVPKTQEGLSRSAQQYKTLRLQALQQSPLSFSATYASESALPDEYWTSRLSSTESETFICGSRNDNSVGQSVEWVAQLTLLGPRTKEQWTPQPASSDTDDTDDEERWQLLGLYNLPDYRGKGIAKALCLNALKYLAEERAGARNVVVRLMVKGTMPEVVLFYEKLGFETVGRCSLADALVANGERHMLPEDWRTQDRLTARGGGMKQEQMLSAPVYIMEKACIRVAPSTELMSRRTLTSKLDIYIARQVRN